MVGSASFQSLNGARLGKKSFARTFAFDPRSNSRTNWVARRSVTYAGSHVDSAAPELVGNRTGVGFNEGGVKHPYNTSSNLARSLHGNTQDGAVGGTVVNSSRSGPGVTGMPSAGNIVRVQSHKVKWGATLQQAIPKAVLVKPSSSWNESNDTILSTSFPNEKELASLMHLSEADRMIMARSKATTIHGSSDVKLSSSASSDRTLTGNSLSNSPNPHSPQRNSSPIRDRFGSPPRSPGGSLYNKSPHRHPPSVSITPLRLGGAAMDQSEEMGGARRSHRRSISSHRASMRFFDHGYTDSNNPFKKRSNQVEHISSSRRRLRHLYTMAFDALRGTGELSDDPYALDWPSLSSPAILPLTTDYFPTETELNLEYSITQQYTQCIPDPDELEEMGYTSGDELARELVCQRLAQDFQIITAHDGAGEKLSGGLQVPSFVSTHHS